MPMFVRCVPDDDPSTPERCGACCVRLPYRDAMERHPRSSPLLEFDDAVPAYIEPTEHVRTRDVPRACVVTFFGDSVRRLIQSGRARLITENAWGAHLSRQRCSRR